MYETGLKRSRTRSSNHAMCPSGCRQSKKFTKGKTTAHLRILSWKGIVWGVHFLSSKRKNRNGNCLFALRASRIAHFGSSPPVSLYIKRGRNWLNSLQTDRKNRFLNPSRWDSLQRCLKFVRISLKSWKACVTRVNQEKSKTIFSLYFARTHTQKKKHIVALIWEKGSEE